MALGFTTSTSTFARSASILLLPQRASQTDCYTFALQDQKPLSYLPIPPPRWSRLPTDPFNPHIQPRAPLVPEMLPLDHTARCRCGAVAMFGQEARWADLTLFGSFQATRHRIQYVKCESGSCKGNQYQVIASDLGSYELFLWSASSGGRPFTAFTWELMNGYSAQMLSSETPLASFCITVRYAYLEHASTISFCDGRVFARVSFAIFAYLASVFASC